jgi:hypothetical protein
MRPVQDRKSVIAIIGRYATSSPPLIVNIRGQIFKIRAYSTIEYEGNRLYEKYQNQFPSEYFSDS